ncbi:MULTISPECIES: histidine phosphatase family protein [unclassified Microbacterium]|uniref:histidine phosphatase family protein n=1 Tax=unclassified Microbacterium TaxID=2609290 RepID=UPI0030177979
MNESRAYRKAIAATLTTLMVAVLAGCSSIAAPASADAADTAVTIHLTRHGQTWFNLLDRVQGWSDSPLTDAGRESATTLGQRLQASGIVFDAAYAGDMTRHRDTASLILDAMGSSLVASPDDSLREMSFGGFEGGPNGDMVSAVLRNRGYDTIDQLFPDGRIDKLTLSAEISAANPRPETTAETPEQVATRAVDALTRIARAEKRETEPRDVLVVSSGLTILCVLDALGGSTEEDIQNGSVTTLVYDGESWTVGTVNDTGSRS